jgi:hypothetical protein
MNKWDNLEDTLIFLGTIMCGITLIILGIFIISILI